MAVPAGVLIAEAIFAAAKISLEIASIQREFANTGKVAPEALERARTIRQASVNAFVSGAEPKPEDPATPAG